jgi:hypothetical protein
MTPLVAALFDQGFLRTMIFLMLAFLWGFALFELAKSDASGASKAIWALVIVLLPVVGAVAYLLSHQYYAAERPGVDPREESRLDMTRRTGA